MCVRGGGGGVLCQSFDFSDLTKEDLTYFHEADRINPLPRLPQSMLEQGSYAEQLSDPGWDTTPVPASRRRGLRDSLSRRTGSFVH